MYLQLKVNDLNGLITNKIPWHKKNITSSHNMLRRIIVMVLVCLVSMIVNASKAAFLG